MAEAAFKNAPLLTPEQLASRLDEFHAAVDEFNRGWYFESHETLEDLWMVTPWPQRQFFQAIIQLAAAFVHYARGEFPGILKLLDAATDKLQDFRPEQYDVDVDRLVADISTARAALTGLRERLADFDEALIPTIRYRSTT